MAACVHWQDEGGQLQGLRERGADAAAEELQMRLRSDDERPIRSR